MDAVVEAWEWTQNRWGLHSTLPGWLPIVLTLCTALSVVGTGWRVMQYPCTVFHELGHAYVGRACGRSVTGIRLAPDVSGVTHSAGGQGVGMVLMLLAGYLTPPLAGWGCTWAITTGRSGAAALLLAAGLAVGFPLCRNVFAVVSMGSLVALFGTVIWVGDPWWVTLTVQVAGAYLGVAGVRSVVNLWVVHDHGLAKGSDAQQLAEATLIPARVWVMLFAVAAVSCAGLQVVSLVTR